MKARKLTVALAVAALVLGAPAAAAAQQGGGNGQGGGAGGPGGPGGGGGKGGEFAELVLAHRDADGLPILQPYPAESPETYCVQPITTNLEMPHPDGEGIVEPVVNPADGRTVTLVPLFAHFPEYLPVEDEATIAAPPDGKGPPADHDEEEGGEPCDPLVIPDGTDYSQYITEVELERLNLARAPDRVLAQHMKELEALLSGTDPSLVTLDPAGRITFDGVGIDAMPKLQGMREALLETGTLPGAAGYPIPFRLVHPDFAKWSTFELSAFALGGAASKFGSINVDTIAYHDRIMGIARDADSDWEPIMQAQTGEEFVNYRGFEYDRAATFPGWVTYLDPADWQAGYKAVPWQDVVAFPELLPKLDNVAGYAQMANDAIALILFIHNYDSVIAYADPVGMANGVEAQRVADELNAAGVTDPTELPAAPTEVEAEGSNGEVTVTWTPSGEGGLVTGYEITMSPGGKTYTVGADETSLTIKGLAKGRTYTFTVRAIGPGGESVTTESGPVKPLPGPKNPDKVPPGQAR